MTLERLLPEGVPGGPALVALLGTFWPALLAAGLVGLLVGVVAARTGRANGTDATSATVRLVPSLAAMLVAVALGAVVVLRLVPGRAGLWLEAGFAEFLVYLAAYPLGVGLGRLARPTHAA